jgi:predicted DNA-binding transcriptional regulator AlpA
MHVRQLLGVKEVTQEPQLLQTTVYKMSRNRSFNELHVWAQWRFSQEAISTWLANAAAPQETKE